MAPARKAPQRKSCSIDGPGRVPWRDPRLAYPHNNGNVAGYPKGPQTWPARQIMNASGTQGLKDSNKIARGGRNLEIASLSTIALNVFFKCRDVLNVQGTLALATNCQEV